MKKRTAILLVLALLMLSACGTAAQETQSAAETEGPPDAVISLNGTEIQTGKYGYSWTEDLGNGEMAAHEAGSPYLVDIKDEVPALNISAEDAVITFRILGENGPDSVSVCWWDASTPSDTGEMIEGTGSDSGTRQDAVSWSIPVKAGRIYEVQANWSGEETAGEYVLYGFRILI